MLAQLSALDATALDSHTLMEFIQQLAGFADRVHGQLARLTAALDVRGGAADAGYKSASAFLRGACGRTHRHAAGLAILGRDLTKLDATGRALYGGAISADQALIISRATVQINDPDAASAAERLLLDAAADGMGTTRLRAAAEDLLYMTDPDATEARERRGWERRYLSFGLTLGGTGVISGACGDALSLEVIRAAADAFGAPGGAADSRTAAQRRMDGLVAACKTAMDVGTAGSRHAAAPHISVLILDSTLRGEPDAPPGRTGGGAMLTARSVLGLACSAEITPIRWHKGLPMDVGRSSRTETAAIRRALLARDRCCRWPGCGLPGAWCTAHHITPWRDGGRTHLRGLVLLCWVHHMTFIHKAGWTIEGDPNATLYFHHPDRTTTFNSPLPAATMPRAP